MDGRVDGWWMDEGWLGEWVAGGVDGWVVNGWVGGWVGEFLPL